MIRLKSIYADSEPEDGTRVLVMRRWPRGVKKNRVDEWIQDLGPTPELMQAYLSEEVSSAEFFEKYRREMVDRRDLLKAMAARAEKETITLLCWERRDEDCHRHVLKELIEAIRKPRSKKKPTK
jgi:uncharacterized protein YeaO (DUF488 family)